MEHAAKDVRDLPLRLLERASALCRHGYGEHAIIAAQSACELACEQAIHTAIVTRNLTYMHKSLAALIYNYSVSNNKTRGIYNDLVDDSIEQCRFWNHYKQLVDLRNNIVHHGKTVDSDVASPLIAAAQDLVKHVMARTNVTQQLTV
jgi:uncharacterized protein YutE (UPF0331/DUF86 family)